MGFLLSVVKNIGMMIMVIFFTAFVIISTTGGLLLFGLTGGVACLILSVALTVPVFERIG